MVYEQSKLEYMVEVHNFTADIKYDRRSAVNQKFLGSLIFTESKPGVSFAFQPVDFRFVRKVRRMQECPINDQKRNLTI